MNRKNLLKGNDFFGNLKNSGILVLVVIGVVLILSGNVSAANCGGAVQCGCGDTLTSSLTMTGDLSNCPGNGIIFEADNIVLDCQGHTIEGDGSGYLFDYGIYLNSRQNNTIKNCIIRNFYHGIYLYSSSNNFLTNNTANSNRYGIFLNSSSNNSLTNNTANLNNVTGIYIFGNSNFNKILNNKILNNGKTGITLSNCGFWGHCYDNAGNSNNKIKDNKILNNNVGIFSHQSNSTINNNVVCRNANLDFNSSAWQSSSGDNNTCNNSDGWNDTSVTGCKISCNCINFDFDNDNKVDIFDVVAGLEHLKEEKMIYNKWCSARNYNEIDLFDLLILIEKIGMNTV